MNGQTYLGAVTVRGQDVFLKENGEWVGKLLEPEVSKEETLRSMSIESAVKSLFYLPMLTLQNIEDLKIELESQFSGKAVEKAVADLEKEGILEQVVKGNYRMCH